jgi:hypothetical protein
MSGIPVRGAGQLRYCNGMEAQYGDPKDAGEPGI